MICDECNALGAALPRYEILGTGIRVYFQALKSVLKENGRIERVGGKRYGH